MMFDIVMFDIVMVNIVTFDIVMIQRSRIVVLFPFDSRVFVAWCLLGRLRHWHIRLQTLRLENREIVAVRAVGVWARRAWRQRTHIGTVLEPRPSNLSAHRLPVLSHILSIHKY